MPGAQSEIQTRRRFSGCLLDIVLVVVLVALSVFLITTFVAQPYEVEQDSMDTTLAGGEYLLVDKLTPHFDAYSRGDIVVFNHVRRDGSCDAAPSAPLLDPRPYIKRVIGQPGDVIELRDGHVYVNGSLLDEPYVRGLPSPPLSPQTRWVLPADRLFVMGDNRVESVDSRSDDIGEVCVNDVIGRAVVRYWPLNKLGILQTPAYPNGPVGGTLEPYPSFPTPASPVISAPDSTPDNGAPSVAAQPSTTAQPSTNAVAQLRTDVIDRRPHDANSFTEGLVMDGHRLFESDGYGPQTLREVDPQTGALLRSADLPNGYFAEGIAIVGDHLIQLTWQQHTAFVYQVSDFSQIGTFSYDTEGWGMCYDGARLVMSDGTGTIYFRDPASFDLLGTLSVTNQGSPVENLNELECVGSDIYANVWQTNNIVRIDSQSGNVDGLIDASNLWAPDQPPSDEGAVLNGIAYNSSSDTFLLTGKLWPAMFEVKFVLQ